MASGAAGSCVKIYAHDAGILDVVSGWLLPTENASTRQKNRPSRGFFNKFGWNQNLRNVCEFQFCVIFSFRSCPGLSFAYAHMANLHFAISHTISRPIFLENGKLYENLMVFRKINLPNFKKETFNPPSSAQRPQNMVQNHEKPSLSLFRAFGSGICSKPARYCTSRGLDKFGGSRLAR